MYSRAMAKTWREKFGSGGTAKVVTMTKPMWGHAPGSQLLISTPKDVAIAVKAVPAGATLTTSALREKLAKEANADLTCPLTISIFLRIVAEVACEELQEGEAFVTPFWRVISPTDSVAKKLSCGAEFIGAKRSEEGGQS
jgi:hypothetical protein